MRKRFARAIAIALVSAGCREAPSVRPVESPAAGPATLASPARGSSPAAPAPASSASRAALAIPFESEGACPFECCVYRTWSVRRASDVRTSRDKTAAVTFTLRPGEKVEALTGVVVVSRPGRARASRDVTIEGLGPLRAGDEVSVLHPLGEGYWLVWREGRKGSGQVGKKSDRPGPWDPELHEIAIPGYTWWVHVRDGRGREGWTDAPANFGDNDRCG